MKRRIAAIAIGLSMLLAFAAPANAFSQADGLVTFWNEAYTKAMKDGVVSESERANLSKIVAQAKAASVEDEVGGKIMGCQELYAELVKTTDAQSKNGFQIAVDGHKELIGGAVGATVEVGGKAVKAVGSGAKKVGGWVKGLFD